VRLDVTALPARNPTSMALSPDGSSLVYEGVANGQSQLWVRQLDADVSEPLEGTQGASHPFFAPDGGSLGYFAGGRLWLMEFQTGAARDLAGASFPTGGSWSRDGVILFVPGAGRPVMRVPAAGGEPTPVTDLRADEEFNHRSPSFLPDGRHFLYYVNGVPEARGVHVGNIDTRESRRLFDADAVARYMEPDVLLVIRQRTLFAQAFDPAALVFRGDPSPVATDITIDDQNVAAVSVASRGAVAYRRGAARVQRHLIWFDREGIPVERVGDSDGASALSPSLSPDGRRLVLYRTVNGNMDLWMLEMSSGVLSPLTRDATSELNPIWSPDGQRIVFSKAVGGNLDLYERSTSTGEESLFLSTPQSKAANDWASDGRFVLYRSNEERTGYDLWAVPVGGEREPFPVATADQDQREGQFSPDGRLVAYQSNESGMFQIWVQRFPGGEDKKQVSSFGGAQVRWHPDGNELFYVALDGMLMSVSIRADESGIENGVAVPLFPTQIGGAVRGPAMQQYLVSLESELRFLMNTVTEEASIPITIRLAGRPVP
jgi:Tol biopolymer transport system component